MPATVPKRPTKGAVAPMVPRIQRFLRSAQRELGPLAVHGRLQSVDASGPGQAIEPRQVEIRRQGLGALGGGAGRSHVAAQQVLVDGLGELARGGAHVPEREQALDGDAQGQEGAGDEEGQGDATQAQVVEDFVQAHSFQGVAVRAGRRGYGGPASRMNHS